MRFNKAENLLSRIFMKVPAAYATEKLSVLNGILANGAWFKPRFFRILLNGLYEVFSLHSAALDFCLSSVKPQKSNFFRLLSHGPD